jgi:hypothetical protein
MEEAKKLLDDKKKSNGGATNVRIGGVKSYAGVSMMAGAMLDHPEPPLIYLLQDSGTNRNVVRDLDLLSNYTASEEHIRVGDANAVLVSKGRGELRGILLNHEGEDVPVVYSNVHYCPTALCNAIDVTGWAREQEAAVVFDPHGPNGSHIILYNEDKEHQRMIPIEIVLGNS